MSQEKGNEKLSKMSSLKKVCQISFNFSLFFQPVLGRYKNMTFVLWKNWWGEETKQMEKYNNFYFCNT